MIHPTFNKENLKLHDKACAQAKLIFSELEYCSRDVNLSCATEINDLQSIFSPTSFKVSAAHLSMKVSNTLTETKSSEMYATRILLTDIQFDWVTQIILKEHLKVCEQQNEKLQRCSKTLNEMIIATRNALDFLDVLHYGTNDLDKFKEVLFNLSKMLKCEKEMSGDIRLANILQNTVNSIEKYRNEDFPANVLYEFNLLKSYLRTCEDNLIKSSSDLLNGMSIIKKYSICELENFWVYNNLKKIKQFRTNDNLMSAINYDLNYKRLMAFMKEETKPGQIPAQIWEEEKKQIIDDFQIMRKIIDLFEKIKEFVEENRRKWVTHKQFLGGMTRQALAIENSPAKIDNSTLKPIMPNIKKAALFKETYI